jgi:signal transduction histidine kinase
MNLKKLFPADSSARSIQMRLFILLLRAFASAVLLILLFVLTLTAGFLIYPSSYNPISRLSIVTRLETFYLVRGSWQGVEMLVEPDQDPETRHIWQRTILIDPQGNILLDHGRPGQGTFVPLSNATLVPIKVAGVTTAQLVFDSSPLPPQREGMMNILFPIFVISFFMAIPTTLMGLLLMRRVVTPLAEVIAAARAVAAGNLSTRVPVSGPDDLRALSDSFNHMAVALEQSDSERRNMLADIAHELRTPLTVMRGRLEGIVDGIYPATPDQITPALEETYLLERLVEDLRLLTLAETRQLHFEKREVNLGDLATHVFDLFQAEAEEKSIKMELEISSMEAVALIDPQRSEQVAGNLVSNALRYTPEGRNVRITVTKAKGNVAFSVSDSGPGVPTEDLSSIFNRFWRGEKSRSRASGGAGLGLAIARQLTEAQGGQISAQNLPQGGLQVRVEFPAMES